MTRKLISQGSPFEDKIGYSRAVVDGNWIFVAGTTGYNYDTMSISDDVAEQTDQALKNISWALGQAGATLDDVVRVRYYMPDADEFEATWPVLSKAFAKSKPAATMIACGLADKAMKIEIEVTALKSKA